MGFRTRRWWFPGTAAALALAISGCAGPGAGTAGEAQAPAAAPAAALKLAPTAKPRNLGVVERYAWQSVEQFGEALAAGDAPAFLVKVSTGFYKGYGKLEAALESLIASTSARQVVVAVDSVEVEGERVTVRARWARDFATRSGERSAAEGTTTFLFLGSDTSLRLLDYRGDPPFGIPGL